jgi:hypothetical protein
VLLAATVIGNTPELMVTDPAFNFGAKVHTAPFAHVCVDVEIDAPELLTIVTSGFANVIVMLVYVLDPITVDERNEVSDTSCAKSTVTGLGRSETFPGCSTAPVI